MRGDFVRLENLFVGIVGVAMCSLTASPRMARGAADGAPATALILEKQEGERRVQRSAGTTIGNAPFILKYDPLNGGTKHLVMFTEELTPGAAIPRHKHPGSEEILILQTGRTRVHLDETVKEVRAGATVFIPPDTWISAEVIGNEPVSLIAIFSERGFEEYMGAISVREGEVNTAMSKAELDAVRARLPHAVTYK
jgi:quercetin dioxygenase-like cupin family protein